MSGPFVIPSSDSQAQIRILETARDCRTQWTALASLAALDLGIARTVEPHIDALTILREAGLPEPSPDTTWGVFAAEGASPRLEATPPADGHGPHLLNGIKPWCSLAGELTHAVVTAHVPGGRQAFIVDLKHSGVDPRPHEWVSRGLQEIPSGPVEFTDVPGEAVGGVDWYLNRPGFAWGGIGVAACWYGGALALARHARTSALSRKGETHPIAAALIGQIDTDLAVCRLALDFAADIADRPESEALSHEDSWALALRTRTIVLRAAERIQKAARDLCGPAGLTSNAAYAKADADLTVYMSQHHGLWDDASLGKTVLRENGAQPW